MVICDDVCATLQNNHWQGHHCDIGTRNIPGSTTLMWLGGEMRRGVHSYPSCALVVPSRLPW